MTTLRNDKERKVERSMLAGKTTYLFKITQGKKEKKICLGPDCSVTAFYFIYKQLAAAKTSFGAALFIMKIRIAAEDDEPVFLNELKENDVSFFVLDNQEKKGNAYNPKRKKERYLYVLFDETYESGVLMFYQKQRDRWDMEFITSNAYLHDLYPVQDTNKRMAQQVHWKTSKQGEKSMTISNSRKEQAFQLNHAIPEYHDENDD